MAKNIEAQNIVKVLHMTKLGAGGISTLTVNINKCLDLNKVIFDYLVFEEKKTFYEDIIKKYKAKKRIINLEKYNKNKILLYWKKYIEVKKLLSKIYYDVVHVDASTPLDVIVGLAAKHVGVRTIILHSHIAGDNKKSMFRSIYMNLCRYLMKYTFTDYFAISDSSAKFMFPKSIYYNKNFTIYKNGIIAENYKFDLQNRTLLREKLKLKNKFVIGHIGRFSPEKNHVFLLDVFKEILDKKSNSILFLIGDGPLKKDIENRCKKLKIEDKVVFYGTTHKVPLLLNAMDIFIFPSEFEGLGISAIEAQCSGLNTFCSEGIPNETNVSDLFHKINGFNPKDWATKILNTNFSTLRTDRIIDIKKAGFDIKVVAEKLQSYYIKTKLK